MRGQRRLQKGKLRRGNDGNELEDHEGHDPSNEGVQKKSREKGAATPGQRSVAIDRDADAPQPLEELVHEPVRLRVAHDHEGEENGDENAEPGSVVNLHQGMN